MDVLFQERLGWPRTIAYTLIGSAVMVVIMALLFVTKVIDTLDPVTVNILVGACVLVVLTDLGIIWTYEMEVTVTSDHIAMRTSLFGRTLVQRTLPLADIDRIEVFGAASGNAGGSSGRRRKAQSRTSASGLRGVQIWSKTQSSQNRPAMVIFTDVPEDYETVLRDAMPSA